MPSALTVTLGTITSNSVVLNWTAPANATGLTYTVTGGGTVAISGTTATITGLTGNTTYAFVVSAVNVHLLLHLTESLGYTLSQASTVMSLIELEPPSPPAPP